MYSDMYSIYNVYYAYIYGYWVHFVCICKDTFSSAKSFKLCLAYVRPSVRTYVWHTSVNKAQIVTTGQQKL